MTNALTHPGVKGDGQHDDSAGLHAVIRLADHAHVHMLTNADHAAGNANITVQGGI